MITPPDYVELADVLHNLSDSLNRLALFLEPDTFAVELAWRVNTLAMVTFCRDCGERVWPMHAAELGEGYTFYCFPCETSWDSSWTVENTE